MNNTTFLLDPDFLKLLDLERDREVFVKIISLDFDENALEEIEGRVTQGSISIDGTSSVRRTCSLTLEASELNIHEFYWGLNTKFKLFIGLRNTVKQRYPYNSLYKEYPDICWFNMGTYVISTFNTSQSTSQYTISIQGKDKMTLLNGEIGGTITPLSWDFGKIDEIASDDTIVTKDYLIKDIILESVHEHAQEPYWNIIINDLDDYGLELLEYRGDKTLYMMCNADTHDIEQISFALPEGFTEDNVVFDPRISNEAIPTNRITHYYPEGEGEGKPDYTFIKVNFGDVVGYRTTDLIYPGDLISNVGETVTSMLDKIVAMLGDFEYFYDTNGRFIFQRKKTYLRSTFSPITQNDMKDKEIYIKNVSETSATVYSFDNSLLVTSFSNNPNFANLKNDFSLWGVKTTVNGIEMPIHLRYAIDTKPWMYITYDHEIYVTEDGVQRYSKLIEEYNARLMEQQQAEIANSGKTIFRKQPVPAPFQDANGNSHWWQLLDWANYYQLVSGQYPSNHRMRDYKNTSVGYNGGNPETITLPDGKTVQKGWHVVDVDPETGNLYYGEGAFCVMQHETDESGHEIVVPDYTRESQHMQKWSPTMHSSNCNHYYEQFVYLNENYPVMTLIYDPIIPIDITNEVIQENINNIIIEGLDVTKSNIHVCDWRELIYQMSLDYNRYHHDEDFLIKIDQNNTLIDGTHLYLNGYTKYEQYYIDINGFWRDLYNPNYQYTYHIASPSQLEFDNPELKKQYFVYESCKDLSYAFLNSISLFSQGDSNIYYKNYKGQYLALNKKPTEDIYLTNRDNYYYIRNCNVSSETLPPLRYNPKENYYTREDGEYDKKTYWSSIFKDTPEGINFWFDFLDTEGDLSQYKVCNIGDRVKAGNDTNVKSIYFREVPTVVFVGSDQSLVEEKAKKGSGYTYMQLNDFVENLFTMSSQRKSAMDVLDDWLYSYAYCTESISINTLPIYYLEPNTRICVRDDNSGINGEYIITRLNIPLGYNGTMSISATKAVENLY